MTAVTSRSRSALRLALFTALAVLMAIPAARAQQAAGIAGVVRDTSGLAMPGVTVEAASPALIEKTRTVVTDGEGRYSIVDLRPGTYTVIFSLDGLLDRQPRRHRAGQRFHRAR